MIRAVPLVPLLAIGLMSPTLAHALQLNDTGQIACYDDTGISTGTVSGGTPAPESTGFARQDCSLGAAAADAAGKQIKLGNSSVKGRDYTKLDNSGNPLADSVTTVGRGAGEWSCTRDNVTGLIWLLRTNDGGFGDQDHRYSFGSTNNTEGDTCEGQFGTGTQCTTDPVLQAAKSFSLCGGNDWNLPTPSQLESLLAYDNPGDPANLIDHDYFPDQVNNGTNALYFWSRTESDTGSPAQIWVADFSFGWIGSYTADAAAYLRLVRAAPTAVSPRFSTSAPGTAGEVVVTDAETGLMWKQCPQGLSGTDCATGTRATLSWSGALTAAAGETFAGFSDWRLPNINELASIRDYTAIDAMAVGLSTEFKGTTFAESYWSSTNDPRASSTTTALAYQYGGTTAHLVTLKSGSIAVRLVRAGKFLSAYAPGTTTVPSDFSIAAKSGPANSLVASDPIQVAGLGTAGLASVRVSGATESAYKINGGEWSTLATAVKDGDMISVRHRAAASVGATATTTLNIGGKTSDFVSTASASPPTQPTNVVAMRGNASVTLTFTAPSSDGGAAITAYTAISFPAGGVSNCSTPPATSCSVTGLTNGQGYTFRVKATNSAGDSLESPDSNLVTPATVPGQPTGLSATAGIRQATVSFTQPASNGGSMITGYTATSTQGGLTSTGCTSSPCVVTGLANGATYTFTVTATNAIGTGEASAASPSVMTFDVPGKPTSVSATAASGQASVSFTPPASNGGSPITGYIATSNPGGISSTNCTASPCSVSGLTNGTTYTFTVSAQNAVGTGAASSESNSVKPGVPPTISITSSPIRTEFPRNHNSRFIFLPATDYVLTVADADGQVADLAVTASHNNAALLGTSGLSVYRNPLLPTLWGAVLQPVSNAVGSATLTFTVTDADGLSSRATVDITVTPTNLPPKVNYAATGLGLDYYWQMGASIIIQGGGAPGTYQVPNFADVSPGEGEETAQTVTFRYKDDSSAAGLISNVQITSAGALSFTLLNPLNDTTSRSASFITWPVDDGEGDSSKCAAGSEWWGRKRHGEYPFWVINDDAENPRVGPCGSPRLFIVAASDLPIRDTTYTVAQRAPATRVKNSQGKAVVEVSYAVAIQNVGTLPLTGLRVSTKQAGTLRSPRWNCTGTAPACSPTSGTGDVSTVVDIPVGGLLIIDLKGDVDEGTGFVEITADVKYPEGVEGNLSAWGGTETTVLSNGFIYFGGFE